MGTDKEEETPKQLDTLASTLASTLSSMPSPGPVVDEHKKRDFDAKNFEAKKRKIAQRLKAEVELENFRSVPPAPPSPARRRPTPRVCKGPRPEGQIS